MYDVFGEAARGGSCVAEEPSDTTGVQPNAIREQSDPAREQSDQLGSRGVRLRRTDGAEGVVGTGVVMCDVYYDKVHMAAGKT